MTIKSIERQVDLTMLMSINCSTVTSIKVHLKFDDGTEKIKIIGTGDLVDVTYNGNGIRKHIEGKVIKVSAVGTDPAGWYILVDGSGDFESEQAKFAPTSILDIDIIRKADTLEFVQTTIGTESLPFIRINKSRIQWSKDGTEWNDILVDKRNVVDEEIENAEW